MHVKHASVSAYTCTQSNWVLLQKDQGIEPVKTSDLFGQPDEGEKNTTAYFLIKLMPQSN